MVSIDGSEAYTCVGSWRAQWLPETITCYTHKTLNIGCAQKNEEASSNSVSLYPIATLDHYWITAECGHLASTHSVQIWWLIMTVLGSSLVTCGWRYVDLNFYKPNSQTKLVSPDDSNNNITEVITTQS